MADRAPPLPKRSSETATVHLPTRTTRPPPTPARVTQSTRAKHTVVAIEDIKPQSKSNDYVDTYNSTPRLPPRATKTDSLKSASQRNNLKGSCDVHRENLTNESQEYKGSQPPELLPRLPTRLHRVTPPTKEAPGPPVERSTKPAVSRSHTRKPQAVLIVDSSENASSLDTLCNSFTSRREPTLVVVTEPTPQKACKPTQHMTLEKQGSTKSTIRCPDCDRCRCMSCNEDRPLPEHWLCDGNCRLSAESVVDVMSCMCCVKGIQYHLRSSEDERQTHPCACTNTPDCCMRWTTLGLLSLCLPCLWCYFPMKGGVKAAEACYNSSCCRERGCQCDR